MSYIYDKNVNKKLFSFKPKYNFFKFKCDIPNLKYFILTKEFVNKTNCYQIVLNISDKKFNENCKNVSIKESETTYIIKLRKEVLSDIDIDNFKFDYIDYYTANDIYTAEGCRVYRYIIN